VGLFLAAPVAFAADGVDLTVYRNDSPGLFSAQGDGSVNEGYAVAHERRLLRLQAGMQDIVVGGLPDYLDAESLSLRFPGKDANVLSQRLLLAPGANAALTSLVGQTVTVLGADGGILAHGTLLRAGASLLIGDAQGGSSTMVRDYSAVKASGGIAASGSSLQLRVDASRVGQAQASLSYPTSGLGWRAAYVGTLAAGGSCSMSFEARASIANRSGRDWNDATLKLVAGQPNMAKPVAFAAPMAMKQRGMMMEAAAAPAPPSQATLGDNRTYTLAAPINLPDGSVSQVPLYATREVTCERSAVFEPVPGYWRVRSPQLDRDTGLIENGTVSSQLRFKAFDTLPAGYLRVLTSDTDNNAELLGEARIEDTPKGTDAHVVLGEAFDLRGKREVTAFNLDKAGHRMDETVRITLTNAGSETRTVTVREHPNRWNQWTVTTTDDKPTQQRPDLLEYRLTVPADGERTLTYTVRYTWADADLPQ
jgi:hypothetical protein